jgi:Na+-transporting methylmalonyl-CoA/oxaloacetate decarboxylase gamma subunit
MDSEAAEKAIKGMGIVFVVGGILMFIVFIIGVVAVA